MKAWQANLDIQFCLDSYAVVTYITDYLTKGDAGITKELKKAQCQYFHRLVSLYMEEVELGRVI